MLIDLHAHTSGISKCCRYSACQVLECAKQNEIDGIVLTNHYQKNYIADGDTDGFVEKYIEEYFLTKKLGEKFGIRVFWGIEVTVELYPNVHMLVYGVGIDFLRRYPFIFDYTQEELYKTVKENDGVLIQAHPFRNGTTILDTNYLDGIEINCHPMYKNSYAKEILSIAAEHGLSVTCGGDFHADTYRPKCGMYIPDNITDSHEIGAYIANTKTVSICIHEHDSDVCTKVEYDKE